MCSEINTLYDPSKSGLKNSDASLRAAVVQVK